MTMYVLSEAELNLKQIVYKKKISDAFQEAQFISQDEINKKRYLLE